MELVKNFKQSKLIKYLFIAFFDLLSLQFHLRLKSHFYPVPMTMQTLVVLVIGISFGWKLGVATISLYLFEGIIGFTGYFLELREKE